MDRQEILDLGCGEIPYKPKKDEIVTTLDSNPKFKPTVLFDINKLPFPFPKNRFDKIYASHIIEHTQNTVKLMDELYRIIKPSGILIIRVPHFSSRTAWINPTHYRAFSIHTFEYFNQNIPQPYGKCNFKIMKVELHWLRKDVKHSTLRRKIAGLIDYFANKNLEICERIWCFYVGGFSEIYLELKAVK